MGESYGARQLGGGQVLEQVAHRSGPQRLGDVRVVVERRQHHDASRPESVHRAVERISVTGNINRPLISIQGTLDALTPPATFGDVYDRMVTAAGKAPLHRYVHVPGGTHPTAW
ncbi:hypothetical protein [Kitasatospora sp. NPDC056184]|uniref:hypothetical protein n=1 Tax=Kitasatospora sp. NPDC056184 TaxID=3345738 RepID=UPI0035D98F65